MDKKIIASIWFSGSCGSIGIVIVDSIPENRAYIGLGKGISKEQDEQYIAKLGTPFPVLYAKKLCGIE